MTFRLPVALILIVTLALSGCTRHEVAHNQSHANHSDDSAAFESDNEALRAATLSAFEFVSEWDRAFRRRNDDMTSLQPYVTDDYYADLTDDEPDGSYLTGSTMISNFSLLDVGGSNHSPTVTIKFCADFASVTGHDESGDTWHPNDVNEKHRPWTVCHFVWDKTSDRLIVDGWRLWFDEEPC
ncbi:hypothetical protein [Paramicrobacterium fandaimingii]|uniref:hypothetical protein n=1 Tax=Paramicrobacterium fandaimingii TaxID=2708079 RepID=UPI00141DFECD|nr:hypothetical protein [Microbacterium fandaimingii]